MNLKKFLNKIRSGYTGLKFRTKLLLNFFAVSFVLIFGLTSAYYVMLSNSSYSQQMSDIGRSVSQLAVDLGNLSYNINQASELAVTNFSVRTAMSAESAERSFDEQIEDYALLRKVVNDVSTNNLSIYTTLYFQENTVYLGRDRRFSSIDAEDLPWLEQLDMRYGRPLWTNTYTLNGFSPVSTPVVGMARIIRDYGSNAGVLGIACVYVETSALVDLLNTLEASCRSRVLLLNGETVIASTHPEQIGLSLNSTEKFSSLDPADSREKYQAKIDGEKYLVNQAEILHSGWRLISIAPVSNLKAENRQALAALAVSFIFVCLVLLALDSLLSMSLTRRVKTLLARVVQPNGSGGIGPQEKVEFYNELQQIVRALADMEDQNRMLTEHIFQEELEKKGAQLSAMQAQIDSHFLYNSLDVINWMALEHGTEDISHMVQLLSRFYRISLSKGSETVTLADEAAHAQTYLEIQKIRFGDVISYTIQIQPDIQQQKVVKLILQPIVENSIVHGLMEKPVPGGSIDIRAVLEGNHICITVSDDGIGIPPEKVALINAGQAQMIMEDNQAKGSHFGLRNIQDRLRLHYQDKASLRVKSSPEGTTVKVIIPITQEEP